MRYDQELRRILAVGAVQARQSAGARGRVGVRRRVERERAVVIARKQHLPRALPALLQQAQDVGAMRRARVVGHGEPMLVPGGHVFDGGGTKQVQVPGAGRIDDVLGQHRAGVASGGVRGRARRGVPPRLFFLCPRKKYGASQDSRSRAREV